VSLREALVDAGGVPGWIATILDRGIGEDPARRFASMNVLLAELAHDPARRWRRGAIAAVALSAAVGAFAFGRAASDDSAAVEPCSGAAAELATSWNPALRDRVAAHLRSLGPVGAADAQRVATELDEYATAWVGESKRVCLANERREVTPTVHERRLACLVRTRHQLAAVGELMSSVEQKGLASALVAARSLPDSHGCADEPGSVLPPPAALVDRVKAITPLVERALVRATAKHPDAIAEASAATARARETGYLPLIARAVLVEGRARVDTPVAAELFAEAMRLALRSSDELLAVEAYARWIFSRVVAEAPATDYWDVMVEIAERLGRPARFPRALMYSNRGLARLAADDRDGARSLFETALATAGDADDIELVSITQNLAQLESKPEDALRRFRAAHDRFTAALGPAHPVTLIAAHQVAVLTPDRAAAAAGIAAAYTSLERWQRAYPELAWAAAWIADEAGDRATAAAWMARVSGEGSTIASIAAAYVAVERGAPDAAARLAEIEQLAAKLDTTAPWNRTYAADALILVARAKPEAWERALALLETKPLVLYSRKLARARRMVAERWATTRPAEARRLAEQALAWYRGAPGDAAIVTRLEQIAATGSR